MFQEMSLVLADLLYEGWCDYVSVITVRGYWLDLTGECNNLHLNDWL